MTRRSLTIALLLVFLFSTVGTGQQPAAAPRLPEQRIILAVLDLTPSFRYGAESVNKIKGVVRALGPGDTFLLMTLGGDFSPSKDVAIQCVMPRVDSEMIEPADNIRVWHERQARIDAAWTSSTQKQAAILKALDHPFKQQNVTPLYQLLGYVSHWFASTPGDGKRVLLIFSDLQHDYAGLRSALPPKQRLPFGRVSVAAAFVPWGDGWSDREKAWREWVFPADFTMLDEARARAAVLVTPNETPRSAPKAF